MLTAAPFNAQLFITGGPAMRRAVAANVPAVSSIPAGPVRDAAERVIVAREEYQRVHAHGRRLLEMRAEIARNDERTAVAAGLGAGGQPEPELPEHDAVLADLADRFLLAGQVLDAAIDAMERLDSNAWEHVREATAITVGKMVSDAEKSVRNARSKVDAVERYARVGAWAVNLTDARQPATVAAALDSLDAAQERLAVLRDGEPVRERMQYAPVKPSGVAGAVGRLHYSGAD